MCLAGLTDDELIERSRAGASEAFGELVERHQQRLFAGLLKMLGSTEQARDAVQEAFILAYQKLDTFQGHAAFSTWVFRIAVNAALTEKRRKKRGATSLDQNPDCPAEPVDYRSGSDPTEPTEQRETQHLVQAALQALPEEFRTVLVLKEIEGFRYEEIAAMIGIPLGTVRSRIHRARNELRQKLRVAIKDRD